MLSSAEKTNHSSTVVQQKTTGAPFFRKAGEESFFGSKEKSSFFNAPVQTKLTVSSPDDLQEKEADAVADQVMRMSEPVAAPAEKKEEEKLQRQGEEVQAKTETPLVNIIQREKKEEEVHPKEEKEEEKVQPKFESPSIAINRKEENEELQAKLFHHIHRSEDAYAEHGVAYSDEGTDYNIARKNISLHHSDVIQRSGRGPPGGFMQFEQSLASSKGGGSAMNADTRQFMESRFNADFSGVRIHTGSNAENLSRSINAQAFAHGNDIYFNSGKYTPGTSDGSTLLAHELTHTIQQGASRPVSPLQSSASTGTPVSPKPASISRKQITPSGVDNIPEQTVKKTSRPRSATETKNASFPKKNKPIELNKPAFNNKPRTLQELQNDLFKVNRKEDSDNEDAAQSEENNIRLKTELSSWQVDKTGSLQTNHSDTANVNDDKKIQPKEEEKEEDKKGLSNQPEIQKKTASEIQCRCNECNEKAKVQSQYFIQSKTETTESSLNHEPDGSASVMSNEKDRGPPSVQMISNAGSITIHRSWLDDAWDSVSGFVGEAADIIAQGLDAAKEWILEKIRTFVQNIPGYNILGLILQHDPITQQPIERSGRNILLAGLQLIPGGSLFQQVLERIGAIDEAAAWIDTRMSDLLSMVSSIGNRFSQFMHGLSLDDIGDPEGVLSRVGELFRGIFNDITGFMSRAAGDFLEMIKRIMLRLIVDFVRERIPRLYPLLRVALGHDPVTGEDVPRNGHNILYAALDVTDSGREQRRQMEETGTFDRVAAWIDRGIAVFTTAYNQLRQAFTNLWSYVTIENLFSPIETFTRIYNDFAAPISLVSNFLVDLAVEIIRIIKDALLRRLRDFARGTRGYYLVTVIIGRDPFTGEVVPRTVANIIHGFMSLMEGGEEQYRQMEESGAIARTTQRIEAAVARLNMTPAYIIGLFSALWHSFGLQDLAHPIDAFRRIVHTFGEPIGRLIDFVIEIVKIVIHVILEIMNFPFDLINNIITRAMAAFEHIKRDPIGFLKNLLRAIKQGFIQFFDHIITHLLNGLTGWLMSELRDANVPAPTDFSLRGIIGWVLQVLGISMEAIWTKLAAHPRIGPERVARIRSMIGRLEGIWTFIKDVQERGMAAIWDKIQEQLSNLWNTVLDAIKNWVMERIINQMVARLLSMLDPTGIMAVINSAIAIYRAVQSFIRYLRQMLEVVNSFVNGVADIAEGNITTAANYLENTMDRAMPIVIGFLANQVGLSGIGRRIAEIINVVRGLVDRALTWLVNRAVDTGFAIFDRLVSMGRSAVSAVLNWARGLLSLQQPFTTADGANHRIFFIQQGDAVKLRLNPSPEGDYVVRINEVNASPTVMANIAGGITVPLKRNGSVVGTVAVPSGSVNMAALKGYALQVAQHLNNLIDSNMRTRTDTATGVQDQTPDFSASLLGLSTITSHLLSSETGGPLPVTPVPVYTGLTNGFANSMSVKPLTRLGVPGTAPSVDSPVWSDLLLRKETPGGRTYYIAGHLLNHNIHGSGSTWENLTPIAQRTNAQHEANVESKIKDAVNTKNLIMEYSVNVDYAMPRKDNLIQEIEHVTNWQTNSVLNEKHKIIEAEAKLPTQMRCSAKQVKADGTDLPATDPAYDAQYNFSGVTINNTANVSQASLDNYYLASATAVTYKDITTLATEANVALASNPGLTYNAFYNNPANKVSIDNLADPDKETLRNIFRKREIIDEERSRINGLMDIQTWQTFTSGRVAYSGPLLSALDKDDLHQRFYDRMIMAKGFFFQSLSNYINQRLVDPATAWGAFRNVQQLFPKGYEYPSGTPRVIISESEIQTFKTTVFDPRIRQLQTAAASTHP